MGDIIGDINKKRGRVLGMEPEGEGTKGYSRSSIWQKYLNMHY